MKLKFFLYSNLLVLFFIILPLSGYAEILDRSFWDKAVEVAEKNSCLVPMKIQNKEYVFNQKGRLIDKNHTHLQIFKLHQQQTLLDVKLILRQENGMDKTSDYVTEFNENKKEILDEILKGCIFRKKNQKMVTLTSMEHDNKKAVYKFSLKVDGIEFYGTATIDKLTKCALESTIICDLLKKDNMLIKGYEEKTYYKIDKNMWYPERIIQSIHIETMGFDGFIKEETVLIEYFCNENDQKVSGE